MASTQGLISSREALLGKSTFSVGSRDYLEVFGWPETISPMTATWLYDHFWLAKRIVTLYPSWCWQSNPILLEDGERDTPNTQAFNDFARRTRLWSKIRRLDSLSRLTHYGFLYFGLPGEPMSPVDRVSLDNIVYLSAFGSTKATYIDNDFDDDPSSPTFGFPRTYQLSPNQRVDSFDIHNSRGIHVVEDPLEDDLETPSVLQVPGFLLFDLMKVTGSASEAWWMNIRKGQAFAMDADATVTPDAEQDMSDQIDEYEAGLRRMLLLRGITVKDLGTDPIDPSFLLQGLERQLAFAIDVPYRVLFGVESGQLAGTSDSKAFANKIEQRRNGFIEGMILDPLLEKLNAWGALTIQNPTWLWSPIIEETASDQSKLAAEYIDILMSIVSNPILLSMIDIPVLREALMSKLPADALEVIDMGEIEAYLESLTPSEDEDETDEDDEEPEEDREEGE